ncbi:MAG: methyltransferase domain-containing protein [Saprospirales bacterium]|nr:MAG: methyltransferase domain-containing protein [Saprospirales bacterium]
MKNKDLETKKMVREKYAEIALNDSEMDGASCCNAGTSSGEVYSIMTDDYGSLKGYAPEADLGLGCGLPTEFAMIKRGDTVIDLGSGAGNDCFVARHQTGAEGKVIGIDFTPEMVNRARANADRLGFKNVQFREGDIENMPVGAEIADVVVSNCVLNLLPSKANVFREIFRVLKPGGHFSISDIVLEGSLPEKISKAAEMYAGCVSGAIKREDYLELIQAAGFENIRIQKEKKIVIPDDILGRYLDSVELENFKRSDPGIYSITIYAEKPLDKPFCIPGGGCC